MHRATRNLSLQKPVVTKTRFWKAMSAMRLTSGQKSGPNGAVAKLVLTMPYPLAYEAVVVANDPRATMHAAIQESGGIRFHTKIADELSENLANLEGGGWNDILNCCNQLTKADADKLVERKAAHFISSKLAGIGPKQSRNTLQALGLTRYEIPIDVRVTKWLRKIGFPIPVNANLLSDSEYYDFVLDRFQELCTRANIFPCELDAMIFAEGDRGAWTAENQMEF